MRKILTLNKISSAGLNILDAKSYTYNDNIENPDAVLVRSASMHDMEFDETLLAIARAGAGVNNIPTEKCDENGIVVFNTPGANANAVKELAVCALLLSSRKIVSGIEWVKTLKGQDDVEKLVEKGKSAFAGPEISRKKLGVIGLGAIGILVANAGRSLGMDVYGYDPYISVDGAWSLSRSIKHIKSIDKILDECDYISLHLPLTKDTKHIINKDSIAHIQTGTRILNFSRAGLVNDEDILGGIESGKIASYVTDFPTAALVGQEGVIAIPHLGASTEESEDNCARMAAKELISYIEKGEIYNSVNFPTVRLGAVIGTRICVIHKNIPKMITQISGAVTEIGVNIENMVNRSRNENAYTVLDIINADVVEEVVDTILAIDGVLRVRMITEK